MNLIAKLPVNRARPGKLEVWHEGSLLATFPCLGKADNKMAAAEENPTRNPIRPFGDTPLGNWTVRIGIIMRDKNVYGPHPVIILWPIDGQAKRSYDAPNRRSGIWIHGGALNDRGELRPTYGCVRVHNESMARLHDLIRKYGRITNLLTEESKEETHV